MKVSRDLHRAVGFGSLLFVEARRKERFPAAEGDGLGRRRANGRRRAIFGGQKSCRLRYAFEGSHDRSIHEHAWHNRLHQPGKKLPFVLSICSALDVESEAQRTSNRRNVARMLLYGPIASNALLAARR